MLEELIDFNLPVNENAIITIIGVGGGGNNAVNRMFEQGINDVDYMIVNTDEQALHMSPVPLKVRIGKTLTEGRGAGNRPDIGEQAAIENIEDILSQLSANTKMVFIVAGMGGGTGTGATPVIAKACREIGILTVAVVTLPFRFEGPLRLKQAVQGIDRLRDSVDAMLIIHNEKLREIYGNLSLSNAFGSADNVLMLAVKGIAEIITVHGYINVDFADVLSVMTGGGIAFMGSAQATGADRALKVIEETIHSPLLNNNDIKGARKVLLNIAYGHDEITVDEIGTITDTIIKKIGGKANTIWGTCYDETLGDSIRITLVATGFSPESIDEVITRKPFEKVVVSLDSKADTQEVHQESIDASDEPEQIEQEQFAEEKTIVPLEMIDQVPEETEENDIGQKPVDDQQQDNAAEEVEFTEEINQVEPEPVEAVKPEPADTRVPEPVREDEYDPYSEEKEQLRINAERLRALNYTNIRDPKKVDELEREPAYKRRHIPVQKDIFPENEEKSRYTVGGKDNRLRSNNTYLHDAVD